MVQMHVHKSAQPDVLNISIVNHSLGDVWMKDFFNMLLIGHYWVNEAHSIPVSWPSFNTCSVMIVLHKLN